MPMCGYPVFPVSPPHTLPLPVYQQITSRKDNKEPVAIHFSGRQTAYCNPTPCNLAGIFYAKKGKEK